MSRARRTYKTKGKSGCRAYLGRKYLGYFASMQAAREALDKSKPIEKATVVEKAAQQKVYKYVVTRQTKKGPMYQGALWTRTKVGKQTQRTKKFSSGQVPEGGSWIGSRVLGDDAPEHQSGKIFARVASAIC